MKKLLTIFSVAAAALVGPANAVLVYDSISQGPTGFLATGGVRFGDDARLINPANTTVISMDIALHASAGAVGPKDLYVGLWHGGAGAGSPPLASPLWEGFFPGTAILLGLNNYSFAVPSVDVSGGTYPVVTWTIRAVGGFVNFGPRFTAAPPAVGTSVDGVWYSANTAPPVAAWTHWVPLAVNQFGARINAVPEPATLAVLGLGLVALARRRKR